MNKNGSVFQYLGLEFVRVTELAAIAASKWVGRGESEEKVKVWLSVAAKIPGVVGFAAGRTIFKQPLLDLHQAKITRDAASQKIAENFKSFVDLFINSKNS